MKKLVLGVLIGLMAFYWLIYFAQLFPTPLGDILLCILTIVLLIWSVKVEGGGK